MRDADYDISIIITSFNHKAYLEEALESVLSQSVPPFEVIVADDGSTDGSREMIRGYEQRYPDLVRGVFQERNVGIPRNRNAALRAVRGNYVGILDGDDVFLPEKLERQVEALRRNRNARAVYGNFNLVDANRKVRGTKWRDSQPQGRIFADVAAIKTGLLRTLIAEYRLVKRAGFLDERLPRYDGLLLTIKLAALCEIAYVDDVLIDKRDHTSSDSKGIAPHEHFHDLELIFDEIKPLLREMDDREQSAALTSQWNRRLAELQRQMSPLPSA